ncbi:uncharacterized protein [Triticum aestivum]|uniref:uncharacterized protein n=1 Tax=Triticum aestivum TaxID=4565 RepID=UPI001D015408|nr:uncharacterized protein LOC123114544 [Triticum aestivum]
MAKRWRSAAGGAGDAAGPKAAGGGRRGSRLFARSRCWARRGGAQGGGRRAPRPPATGAARHGSGPQWRGAGSRLLARAAAAAEASMESPTPKSPYELEPTNELALAHIIPSLDRVSSCQAMVLVDKASKPYFISLV